MIVRPPEDPDRGITHARLFGYVATAIVAILPPVIFFGVSGVLPLAPEQQGLLHAGSVAIGLSTAAAVYLTFGQLHARRQRDEERFQARHREVMRQLEDAAPASTPVRRGSLAFELAQLHRHDPAFSEPNVHLWARALVPAILAASAEDAHRRLRPFVAPPVYVEVQKQLAGAEEIRIARVRTVGVSHEAWDTIALELSLIARRGDHLAPTLQRWVLRRSTSARSLPLADMLALACPACGSPVEVAPPEWACAACDRRIGEGQLHWQLVEVSPIAVGALRDPLWRPDEGGDHPSVSLPMPDTSALAEQLAALRKRAPAFDLVGLDARIRRLTVEDEPDQATFDQLVLDALGLQRARTTEVASIDVVRAGRDGAYDLLDVRIVAEGIRHLADMAGHTIDGHPEHPRRLAFYARLAAPIEAAGATDAWQAWAWQTPAEHAA